MKSVSSLLLLLLLAAGVLPVFALPQTEQTGPVQLIYWTDEDPNRTPLEGRPIAEFQQQNPNASVVRETSPSSKTSEKLLTAFAVHRGPDMLHWSAEVQWQYIEADRGAPLANQPTSWVARS